MIGLLRTVFVIVFVMKALECLTLFGHGDALNYHLVGPRLWLETSWLEMTRDLYLNFQSGVFDLLYVIPIGLFGPTVWGQVGGQFLHFFCSLGIGSLFLWFYWKKRGREVVGLLAGISILTLSYGSDFFLYAKNDGVVALVALLAFVSIEERRVRLAGLLIGLLPAIKMSGLLVAAPLAVYLIWRDRSWKSAQAAVLALLSFSPMLARNLYFLETPFFPVMVQRFPGNLTPSMIDYYHGITAMPLDLQSAVEQLRASFVGKLSFLFAPLLLILNWRRAAAYWIALFCYLVYIVMTGGHVAPRFLFASYFLTIWFLASRFAESSIRERRGWVAILLILSLADSKLDQSVRRFWTAVKDHSSLTPSERIAKYSPWSSIWFDVEGSDTEKVFVLSDNFSDVFYAPKGVRLVQLGIHPDAEFLRECQDVTKLQKFKYAILRNSKQDACYEQIQRSPVLKEVDGYRLYRIPGS